MLDEEKMMNTEALIDEALKAEPVYFLPDDFASNVAETAGRKFAWQQYLREFLVYLAAIVGIAVLAAAMALIWFDVNWKNWFDFLMTNAVLVAGINLLLLFVLFTDRVLLRYFLYRSATKNLKF